MTSRAFDLLGVHSSVTPVGQFYHGYGNLTTASALFSKEGIIANFIGLPYFSGFLSGFKSNALISHD